MYEYVSEYVYMYTCIYMNIHIHFERMNVAAVYLCMSIYLYICIYMYIYTCRSILCVSVFVHDHTRI